MKINSDRLLRHLKTLGQIGFKENTGTSRPAYSPAYLEGQKYVASLMKEAGLSVSVDPVGNLIGELKGSSPDKKIIAIGSHIDSVPGGGIYDGTLGVLAAVECVQTMQEQGYRPEHTLQIIAFEDEEGNVIGGTFGSKAFTGAAIEEAMIPRMAEQGISAEDVKRAERNPGDYLCYLELHIEQGGLLEAEKKTIGVAGGIVAILRYKAVVEGKTNHAGSTPMRLRDDALEKSCYIIADFLERVKKTGNSMVGTVGVIQVEPGAVNVVPGRTEFIIEMRDMERTSMYRLIDELERDYQEKGLHLSPYIDQEETRCHPGLLAAVRTAADKLGYSRMEMHSGAGHDLINMGKFTPSALIFIPSKGGISHSIEEYSAPEDIEAGADVLLHTILSIDKQPSQIQEEKA